jgi:hypothetical protein
MHSLFLRLILGLISGGKTWSNGWSCPWIAGMFWDGQDQDPELIWDYSGVEFARFFIGATGPGGVARWGM